MKEFDQMTGRQLPAINIALQRKKIEPLQTLSEQQWQQAHDNEGGGQQAASPRWLRERD
jgi:hypothetical protein